MRGRIICGLIIVLGFTTAATAEVIVLSQNFNINAAYNGVSSESNFPTGPVFDQTVTQQGAMAHAQWSQNVTATSYTGSGTGDASAPGDLGDDHATGSSTFELDFTVTHAGSFAISGFLSMIGGTADVTLTSNDTGILFQRDANGSFLSVVIPLAPGDYSFSMNALGDSTNMLDNSNGAFYLYDMTIQSPAPEPSTLILAALGGLALLAYRRRV